MGLSQMVAWFVVGGMAGLAGCQDVTIRVVDAETKAPLAKMAVERQSFRLSLPMYIEAKESATDEKGEAAFKGMGMGEWIHINPAVRPMGAVSLWSPRWTNGRRDLLIESVWPEVEYRNGRGERKKAERVNGVAVIPMANEAAEHIRRIEAILGTAPAGDRRADEEIRQQCYGMMSVGPVGAGPVLRRVFTRARAAFEEKVADKYAIRGRVADLLEAANLRAMADDPNEVAKDLRQILEANEKKMDRDAVTMFRERLEDAGKRRTGTRPR